jgi:hypothetical protein
VGDVAGGAPVTRDQHRVGRIGEEAAHAAALVGLEVAEHDVGEPLGVEYLRDRVAHRLVGVIEAGVHERR